MFLVCGHKWGEEGDTRHFQAGVTDDFELAQTLMTAKAIFILEKKNLLNGRELTFSREFGPMETVDVPEHHYNHIEFLRALQDLQLADDHSICIHYGTAGFLVKIKEVQHYDENNIEESGVHWETRWREKVAEKAEMMTHSRSSYGGFPGHRDN